MHSSRMRVDRISLVPGGVYLVRGGVVYLVQGGVVYLVLGGVPGPGGCTWSGGVPGPGGVPGQVLPPSVNRITHTCKNITLPQLRCGR